MDIRCCVGRKFIDFEFVVNMCGLILILDFNFYV